MKFEEFEFRDDYESLEELKAHLEELSASVEQHDNYSLKCGINLLLLDMVIQNLEVLLDLMCREFPNKTRNQVFVETMLPIWKEELSNSF